MSASPPLINPFSLLHLFWPKLPLASWTVTGAWRTGCNSYAQNCMNNLNSGLFLLVPGCSDVWPISDRLQEEGTRWVERCWRTWPRCVWRGSPNSAVWRMFGEPKAAVFDEIIPVWHLRGSSYPCWASAVLSPDRAQHTRLPPMLATCELQGTGQGCLGSLLAALGTSTPGVSRQMLQWHTVISSVSRDVLHHHSAIVFLHQRLSRLQASVLGG